MESSAGQSCKPKDLALALMMHCMSQFPVPPDHTTCQLPVR